jgi:hypothetical protein
VRSRLAAARRVIFSVPPPGEGEIKRVSCVPLSDLSYAAASRSVSQMARLML